MRFQEKLHEYSKEEIWEEYCRRQGVTADHTWFEEVEKYEQEVLLKR